MSVGSRVWRAAARIQGRPAGLVGALVMLMLTGAPGARAQFTVSPGTVQFAASDSAATAAVYVRNDGDREIQFRFYLGDFEQLEDGDYNFLSAGSSPQSCSGRLEVFPEGALLPAGRQEAVRLRMQGGSAGCWSMLFVEAEPEGDGPVRVAKRVAAKVFALPAGGVAGGEITRVEVGETGQQRMVEFEFRNTGDLPVQASGYLEIRSLEGAPLQRTNIERFSVLPKHSRRVGIAISEPLPRGSYLAIPVLDFGAEYAAGGQALFSVP